MKTIQDLLISKQIQNTFSISSKAGMLDAVDLLGHYNVRALLVIDSSKLVGILSERDIVRALWPEPHHLNGRQVGEFMSKSLVTVRPTDELESISTIMTQNRIGHLPVVGGDEVLGLISIGDVVNAQASEIEFENRLLTEYISGKYPA